MICIKKDYKKKINCFFEIFNYISLEKQFLIILTSI